MYNSFVWKVYVVVSYGGQYIALTTIQANKNENQHQSLYKDGIFFYPPDFPGCSSRSFLPTLSLNAATCMLLSLNDIR